MRFQLVQAGLRPEKFGKASSRLGTGGGSDDGIRDVILPMGDSNALMSAEDQASYTGWVDDADVVALNSSFAWQKVVPLTFTGMAGGINTGNVGMELAIARRMRLAAPNKRVYIVKNAVTGSKQITQWAAPAGTYFASTKSFLDTAVAAIQGAGFTPRIWIFCQLGENDANGTDYPSYAAAFRTMVANILANWGAQKLIHGRLTSPAGTSMRRIRTIQQDLAFNNPNFYLVDLDGATIGGDGTHFNLSGIATISQRVDAIILGNSDGLREPFVKEDWIDNRNAWTLNAGWAINGDGWLTGTGATSSARLQYAGLEVGLQYRIRGTYDPISGSSRCRFNGGTDVLSAAFSGSAFDVTLTTVTGNVNFDFLPPSGSFTGRIGPMTIERVP